MFAIRSISLTLILALAGASGCHSSAPPAPVSSTGPLTVEEWNKIPGLDRFTPETLDRLRLHDESLKDRKKWEKFVKEVVDPELKNELGGAQKSEKAPS